MQSSRLRSGAASPVSTCMSTPSASPTMPRGSRTPRSPSSEKPTGSECTTSRSAFSACLAPAASTRLMSASSTSWPPRLIVAEKISLFSRPAVRLTISESTVSPAMRSAASTASRMACSARSRSTTTPDFTPCDFWWPMPMTWTWCVRPRRIWLSLARLQLGDHAADLARADIEHRDDAGAARRGVLLTAKPAHIVLPRLLLGGLGLLVERGCRGASTRFRRQLRSTSRSSSRRSTAAMSRDSSPFSRSSREHFGQRLGRRRPPAA